MELLSRGTPNTHADGRRALWALQNSDSFIVDFRDGVLAWRFGIERFFERQSELHVHELIARVDAKVNHGERVCPPFGEVDPNGRYVTLGILIEMKLGGEPTGSSTSFNKSGGGTSGGYDWDEVVRAYEDYPLRASVVVGLVGDNVLRCFEEGCE